MFVNLVMATWRNLAASDCTGCVLYYGSPVYYACDLANRFGIASGTVNKETLQIAKKAGAQPNQSLIDGIETLQALAMSNEPIGCRDFARRLGLETTRVNRLLKMFAYLGLAHQTFHRKYTARPGMHVLAAQSLYISALLPNTIGPMDKLQRLGRVVALGVLWRDSVSYLYLAQAGMTSGEAIGRVGLFPATATASGVGIALLAEAPRDMKTLRSR